MLYKLKQNKAGILKELLLMTKTAIQWVKLLQDKGLQLAEVEMVLQKNNLA